MIVRQYIIRCDHCGDAFDWTEFKSATEASRHVEGLGWKVSSVTGKVLCPACKAAGVSLASLK